MNVNKIASIFSAQTNRAQSQENSVQNEQVASQQSQNNDAVKVSDSVVDSKRAEKIAKLQADYNQGNYNPDTKLVAAAFYKELIG